MIIFIKGMAKQTWPYKTNLTAEILAYYPLLLEANVPAKVNGAFYKLIFKVRI